MPKLRPISWTLFVSRMKTFGFSGPYQEGKHPYMIKGAMTLTVPNPHEGDISRDLLMKVLRQAGISRSQWVHRK
ncbi:type II toxin-antitoxin system HicA family toxin [Candidatus Kaiserbacteria bacterium]|nr:type II toxin-antitoxin system HicA family toxin [Candidatus Kaiserbacteria bacterium]